MDLTEELYQPILLPANIADATLNYWWYMETGKNNLADYLTISIRDNSGSVITTVEQINNRSTENSWQRSTFLWSDAGSYAGQTIYVHFYSDLKAHPQHTTSFFIDDVSFGACVPELSDLDVFKSAVPNPVTAGQALTYTLTYTNAGPSTAEAVTLTDVLPADVTFGGVVSASPPLGAPVQAGHTLTWTLPTLDADDSGTLIFTGTTSVFAGPTVTNTAMITSATYDPTLGNNTAQAVTTVSPPPPATLTGTLRAWPEVVHLHDPITVTLRVTNTGGVTATDATPSALTLSGLGDATLLSGPAPPSVDVGSGQSVTYTWVYSAADLGAVRWTGAVTGTDVVFGTAVSTGPLTSNEVEVSRAIFEAGVAPDVSGQSWTRVTLESAYTDLVVVTTFTNTEYAEPLVTRIRNVDHTGFEVKLQEAGGGDIAEIRDVHYIAMEAGAYEVNGVKFEAQHYESTVTDGYNAGWSGEEQSYLQSYANPVVIGQVMSTHDADWSVFWAKGANRSDPPDATNLWTGKMVSKDADTTRADETVGFIVFEQGHGELFGVEYEARLGENTIAGIDNSPPYTYDFDQNFSSTPGIGLVAKAGENGGHGGYAVLYGENPLRTGEIDLAIDENDAGSGDDRTHINEQVNYVVFEGPLVVEAAPRLVIDKQLEMVGGAGLILPGDLVTYTVTYGNVGLMPATDVVVTDTLPTYLSLLETPPGCTHDGSPTGGLLTCAVGVLTETTAATLTLPMRVQTALPPNPALVNTARISGTQGLSATVTITHNVTAENLLKMETGVISAMTFMWSEVLLENRYRDPVIVATPNYGSGDEPLVVRLRHVGAERFEMKLQNPSTQTTSMKSVHYMVVEQGAFTLPDGRRIEAQQYLSTQTDDNSNWDGEPQTYLQSYTDPVVIGQVMSTRDTRWSVFWERGASTSSPPDDDDLYTGKSVCEDPDTTREDETVGFIVIEEGVGTLGTIAYEAWLGDRTIQGSGDSPPYRYTFQRPFDAPPEVGLATKAEVQGNNGGWAMLYGPDALTADTIGLAIDEDRIGDSERNHTSERVAYVVFSEAAVVRPTHDLWISHEADPDPALAGAALTYHVTYTNTGVLTATNVVITATHDPNVTPVADSFGIGELGPGESGTLDIPVTVNGDVENWSVITDTVGIRSDEVPVVRETITTSVKAYSLALTKVADPDPAVVSAPLAYTLRYTNTGAITLTGVTLTESYPTGVTPVAFSREPVTGTDNVFALGTLTPGVTGALTITMDVDPNLPQGTLLVNEAQMDANEDVTATVSLTTPLVSITKMEVGIIEAVGDDWLTIDLTNTYNSMVVLATPVYLNNTVPYVTRVRNATGNSFQVKLQNPGGASVNPAPVHYLVMEEGIAMLPGGRRIEAQTYTSGVTDHYGSWVGERQTYLQAYTDPIVLGQVMSANDPDWSVFWAHGCNSAGNPRRTEQPDADCLYTGKHVGEDFDTDRAGETIGFIVMESGHGHDLFYEYEYEGWIGTDSIYGQDNNPPPPYHYSFQETFVNTPRGAIVSKVTEDGGNGAWPLLYGESPLTAEGIDLVLDEDLIGDSERWHTSEQVAYAVFEIAPLKKTYDLVLLKAAMPDPVTVGETLVYSLTYVNSGMLPLSGVQIDEVYPPEVSFVASDPAPDAGQDDRWTISNLPDGAEGSIVITTTVDVDLPNGTVLTNTATIDSVQTDPVSQTTATIVQAPVLTLIKVDDPDPLELGDTLDYTLNYANTGPVAAQSVVLTETYDAGFTYQSALPAPTTGDNVWEIGDLAPGDSGAVVITGQADAEPLLTNRATLDSAETPPVIAVETTTVETVPVLHVELTDDPDPVLVGETLEHTVRYWNTGTGDAENAVLEIAVPDHTTFNLGASGPGWTCADAAPPGTSCTYAAVTVSPGSVNTLVFALTVTEGPQIMTTVDVTCDNGDPATDNELTAVALAPEQVSLDKTVSPKRPGLPSERTRYDYRIAITNTMSSDLPIRAITDTLPVGFAYVTTVGTEGGLRAPDAVTTTGTLTAGQTVLWTYNTPYPTLGADSAVALTFAVTSTHELGEYPYCNDASVLIGGDVGRIVEPDLACLGHLEYLIESQVEGVTIVARVRIIEGKPVILSWEIKP